MKCSLKCLTRMSSKLGGTCGHSCALDEGHPGRCKCSLMLRIDSKVTPIGAVDFDAELKEKHRTDKAEQRKVRTVVAPRRKKASHG